MVRKKKEIKKLTQDMMKESIEEGTKLIISAWRDKTLENPYEDEALKEQALQVEAIAESILEELEEVDGALET